MQTMHHVLHQLRPIDHTRCVSRFCAGGDGKQPPFEGAAGAFSRRSIGHAPTVERACPLQSCLPLVPPTAGARLHCHTAADSAVAPGTSATILPASA